MPKNLVIVESPAKAKTIEKYLGGDFEVLASVGHIRKDTKVDKTTFDVTYEVDPEHKKIIAELKKAAKDKKVWLATDEDREGESISWHLAEVLGLPKDTARITFHEITKPALENAISHPRTVDMDMVASQQARQTLDMLVGYDLSDVVRRKVPGAVSAGRVQSPALRLIVEREKEIEKFEGKVSFKITGRFLKDADGKYQGDEVGFDFEATREGEAPTEEKETAELIQNLSRRSFRVLEVAKSDGAKANPTPLTTAAMQIEANAKLGFSARTTMSAAQGLYQAGLITYHRTDSLNLSEQALKAAAGYITEKFGREYLHPRHFKTKDASAQEAHEAIRPTDFRRENAGKNDYERKLYHLIWARTLATQMANAKVAKTTVRIGAEGVSGFSGAESSNASDVESLNGSGASVSGKNETGENEVSASKVTAKTGVGEVFIAKGEVLLFDGFLKVYGKNKDLELPELKKGEAVSALEIRARQTFAKAPARYTEGSLVKKLEELGIGRPSTYASIMTAIQARKYVEKGTSEGQERKVLELTAKNGKISRAEESEKTGANKGKLLPTPIGELVAGFLSDNFKNIVDYKFTANIEKDLDLVAEAKLGRVQMLRDFYGPFHDTVLAAEGVERYNNARLLGHDPETGKAIYAKVGKNGGFIQLGENEKSSGEKPRFAPLPKRKTAKTVTLEQALKQLALPILPRSLGKAADGTELIAAAGPFGPYLKAGKYNIAMKNYDPYTISFEEAAPLYQAKKDSIIQDFGEIMIIRGPYGPYVKGAGRWNNAKIPEEMDPAKISRAKAEKLLAEKPKRARRGARGKRKGATGPTRKSAGKGGSAGKGSGKTASARKKK